MNFGRLLRLLGALAGLGCAFASPASGQTGATTVPQFEVSGTYSYVRANGANFGGFNLNGGGASFTYNFSERFSVQGDFGAYRFSNLPSSIDSTMYTYLFGPRVSLRKSSRVNPFAQVLLGGGHLNASSGGINAGENGFAMALGGGLDLPLGHSFSVRAIQADYLLTRFNNNNGASATQNNLRISAGLVFRFGSR